MCATPELTLSPFGVGRLIANDNGQGSEIVVVRGRESRPQGEGFQIW